MSWLQLTLESDLESAEQLSELLEKFDAVSVSLSAVSDEKIFGQAIEKDPLLWQQTRVVALLHEDTDLDTLLVCLRNCVGTDRIGRHEISRLEDRDWVSEYRLGHGVKIFADRLPDFIQPLFSLLFRANNNDVEHLSIKVIDTA